MDFTEIREKYPQYSDMPDQEFADKFHGKFYADMPKEDFYKKINFSPGGGGGFISNLAGEVKEGAKGVAGAFTPSQEVPIEAQAPEAFGGQVSGETAKMPNIAAAVPGAAQVAFSPVTAAGKTLEQKMVKANPKLGEVPAVPPQEVPLGGEAAPEAFLGQFPITPAQAARYSLETALLPAYGKVFSGGYNAVTKQAGKIRAADLERVSTSADELMGLINPMSEEEAIASAAGWKPGRGQEILQQAEAGKIYRNLEDFPSHEGIMEELQHRMGGKSVEQLQEELNNLDNLMKMRYPAVGPFASAETGEPALAARGPLGTQTGTPGVALPVEGASVPREAPVTASKFNPQMVTNAPEPRVPRYPGQDVEPVVPRPQGGMEDIPKPRVVQPGTWVRGNQGWFGNEKGSVNFWQKAQPIPPQEDLRTALQNHISSGMNPLSAVDKLASDLGRHPGELIQALRAAPAESATTTAIDRISRGAALDETMPVSVKTLSEALVGKEPIRHKGLTPPTPRMMQRRVISPVVPALSKDINILEREIASNNIVSANHFGTVNNPINDSFSSQLSYLDDALRDSEWHSNIVKHLNLKADAKASLKSVQTEMGDLFDEFVALHQPKVAAQKELRVLKTQLDHMEEGSTRYRETKGKIEDLLKQHQKDITEPLSKLYARRDAALYGDPLTGAEGLAKRHANIRMKLAAGGDKRAEALLTEPERDIVKQVRDFYDQKKARLQGAGIRTIDEDYTNFVFKNSLEDKGSASSLNSLWWKKEKPTPAVLDFIQRTPGSKDWFPLLSQSLDAYIPSVNRKLAFTPFLDKWAPVAAKWGETGYPGAGNWLSNFMKSQFSPEATSATNRVMNYYIGSQYLRTLFGNASVPVLHAFKLMQASWWNGPINAAKAAFFQYPKALGQMMTGLEGPERQAIEAYIKLPQLMRTIEQQPGMSGAEYLKPGFWTKMGTSLTAMAEHVGNGINVLSTLNQASSRGVRNLEVINNEIMDRMMRLDFRGFNMPKFMNEHRALTMYQGQPWKLAEAKIDMFKGMLQGKEDAFGDKYLHKFVRMAAVLGGSFAAGQHMGIDLTKHLLHLPYGLMEIAESGHQAYKEGADVGEAALSALNAPIQVAPPPVQFLAEAADPKKGVLEAAKSQLTPVLMDKLAHVKMGEPSLRYENPTMEFFGLPSTEGVEEARSQRERARLLDVMRHPRTQERRKSPTRRLMEEYLD